VKVIASAVRRDPAEAARHLELPPSWNGSATLLEAIYTRDPNVRPDWYSSLFTPQVTEQD